MKKVKYLIQIFILGFGLNLQVNGQVYITGPTCVIPGTTYLYNFQGKWDSSPIGQLCISGGLITDSGKSCVYKTDFSYTKINWNNNITTGTIQISSPAGKATLNVNITTPLNPGTLDSTIKFQSLDTLNIPSIILCSYAKGGSCSPAFSYQWQQSDNNVKWIDLSGATGQHLKLNSPLKQTMYYRRKVLDSRSGSVGYSEMAMIEIIIH